jgi:hypothetical protein
LIKRKTNQSRNEWIIGGEWEKGEKVFSPLRKVAFAPHLVDVIFACARFTERGRVQRVVYYMIKLVKQSPANVEGIECALVTREMLKISKINQYYISRRFIRGIFFPPAGDYPTEHHVRTLTRVFENHKTGPIDYACY